MHKNIVKVKVSHESSLLRLSLDLACKCKYLPIIAFLALPYLSQPIGKAATLEGLDAYVKRSSKWNSNDIPVCWENSSSGLEDEKSWVKDAIVNSWQIHSAVKFTGWNTCHAESKGIRILVDDQNPHTKGLGNNLDGKVNGMVLNFSFKEWSPSCQATRLYCIRVIAIHEFGHALGFAHEQNRPETPAGQPGTSKKLCTEQKQGGDGDSVIGPWDINSVMNYCNPRWNGNGFLSVGDIKAVREVYGNGFFGNVIINSEILASLSQEEVLPQTMSVAIENKNCSPKVFFQAHYHEPDRGWINAMPLMIDVGQTSFLRDNQKDITATNRPFIFALAEVVDGPNFGHRPIQGRDKLVIIDDFKYPMRKDRLSIATSLEGFIYKYIISCDAIKQEGS